MGRFAKEARRVVRRNAPRGASFGRYLAFCPRVERDLAARGLRVRDPKNLRARHLHELAEAWSAAMGAGAVHNLVSMFRMLHRWAASPHRLPSNDALGLPPRRRRRGGDG